MHGYISFDVSTKKIGPYLLVVIGIEGEKKTRKRARKDCRIIEISPPRPDDPSQPIVTIFGEVGGMVDMTKCARFGVDRLIGAGCAG